MHKSRLIGSGILALILSVGCIFAQGPDSQVKIQAQPTSTTIAPTPGPSKCTATTEKPSPVAQTYNVGVCIVARLAAYVKVGANSYVNFENGIVDESKSICESATKSNSSNIVIHFDCGELSLRIEKDSQSGEIYINSVSGFYKVNNTSYTMNKATKLFKTSESTHYYKCDSEQPVLVDSSLGQNLTVQLVLSNFAYEAFRTAAGTDFYKIAEECELDAGVFSDGVRIGIGVCLISFVVIILIAYFVGRRRWAQRSSYESV